MPAIDTYGKDISQLGPARNAVAVTPNDGTDLTNVSRGIIAGSTGNISVNMSGSGSAVVIAVVAGQLYPIAVSRILATGTSATGIVAIW
jgi:hypothetical protein